MSGQINSSVFGALEQGAILAVELTLDIVAEQKNAETEKKKSVDFEENPVLMPMLRDTCSDKSDFQCPRTTFRRSASQNDFQNNDEIQQ